MTDRTDIGPLQPGSRAPDFVLDAITRDGKIAIEDFRGKKPVLVGLFRGLHCAFCRRHIASLAQLRPALNEKGIENLTVVNTPIDRARLYFRYHPMPLSWPRPTRNAPRTGRSDCPTSSSPRTKPPGRTRSRWPTRRDEGSICRTRCPRPMTVDGVPNSSTRRTATR